jgi:large subunit ribosomal protein L21
VGYAIIWSGGKQFRVSEGDILQVPAIPADYGDSVTFPVLMRSGEAGLEIGGPLLEGARVVGTIIEHGRGPKVIVFKKKRKKQYKLTHGHRQSFTAVYIDSIAGEGLALGAATAAPAKDTKADVGDGAVDDANGADSAEESAE